jgi:hypothetical protein
MYPFLGSIVHIADQCEQDDTRAWGPPYAKYVNGDQEGPGESAYYLAVSTPEKLTCVQLTWCRSTGTKNPSASPSLILPVWIFCTD